MYKLTAFLSALLLATGAYAIEPAFDAESQYGGHFGYDSIQSRVSGWTAAHAGPAFDEATQYGGHFDPVINHAFVAPGRVEIGDREASILDSADFTL